MDGWDWANLGGSMLAGGLGAKTKIAFKGSGARSGHLFRPNASTTNFHSLHQLGLQARGALGRYIGRTASLLHGDEQGAFSLSGGNGKWKAWGERNIAMGKPWKNIIRGRGARHGTEGHSFQLRRQAIRMAKTGNYDRVYMDRSLNTALRRPGHFKWNPRPDVIGVRSDGRLDMIEIPSPSQTNIEMMTKIIEMQSQLGDLAGPIGRVVNYTGIQ